jgi:hypothetical protein
VTDDDMPEKRKRSRKKKRKRKEERVRQLWYFRMIIRKMLRLHARPFQVSSYIFFLFLWTVSRQGIYKRFIRINIYGTFTP